MMTPFMINMELNQLRRQVWALVGGTVPYDAVCAYVEQPIDGGVRWVATVKAMDAYSRAGAGATAADALRSLWGLISRDERRASRVMDAVCAMLAIVTALAEYALLPHKALLCAAVVLASCLAMPLTARYAPRLILRSLKRLT